MIPAEVAQLSQFFRLQTEWFYEWRATEVARRRLESIKNILRSDFPHQENIVSTIATHREAKGLREVWVLTECASLMQVQTIQLSKKDPPDAYFKRGFLEVPAEIVEVIEPGRLRNLEYHTETAAFCDDDPCEDWVRAAKALPSAVNEQIKKKRSKPYPNNTELFVYVSIETGDVAEQELERDLRRILSQPVSPFGAIHIYWKGRVFCSSGETFRAVNSQDQIDEEALWRSIADED